MKKALFIAICFSMITTSLLAANKETVSCKCNVLVGTEGVPMSEEVIDIAIELENDGGLYEASSAEIDIVAAYKCLQTKKDVRKIYKLNYVNCEM